MRPLGVEAIREKLFSMLLPQLRGRLRRALQESRHLEQVGASLPFDPQLSSFRRCRVTLWGRKLSGVPLSSL